MFLRVIIAVCFSFIAGASAHNHSDSEELYWMKIKTSDKYERTQFADLGVAIETIREDYIIASGSSELLEKVKATGKLEVHFKLTDTLDFPEKDAAYHNYFELTEKLRTLAAAHSDILQVKSIGKSIEGREIWSARISGDLKNANQLPGSIFMGGHHAREHLSVELPLYYIEYLVTQYQQGNQRIQDLVNARDIHIIPLVNPDGSEFDIESGKYRAWRKNRSANKNGTYGVDLNRNYSFGWGGSGASTSPSSDTYRGPAAFSEPESLAIKNYVESQENITVLLSFHTYSQLILYPWGHSYEDIGNTQDKQVHETMAAKMATWNGYRPQKSSELYLASGDTTDWSYGEHKIISFTFELDPGSSGWGSGGFYPGSGVIPQVQKKNLEPVLYLIEHSDNPYRVL